jgi:hypothetical protein
MLADEGVAVRVIDAYLVKPLDVATIREALTDTALPHSSSTDEPSGVSRKRSITLRVIRETPLP